MISFISPADYLDPQEAVDENEQVFYHQGSEEKSPEGLSAGVSKLSVNNDKSKAN